MRKPLDRLKYHVTGAIERGEGTAIVAVTKARHTLTGAVEARVVFDVERDGLTIAAYDVHGVTDDNHATCPTVAEAEANAAHIQHCLRSHNKMLTTLETLLADALKNGDNADAEQVALLRAAIRSAGGAQ